MTPTEYADRPAGQRELIIAKVADLALSGDARFEVPVVNLLEQLISLGTRLEASEYEETVDFGLLWAFEHVYTTGEIGKARLRRALGAVAPTLPGAASANGCRQGGYILRGSGPEHAPGVRIERGARGGEQPIG